MRALTWQGKREVEVREVPDPVIQEPTDAIVRITTTAICGSDLHLYEVLGADLNPGDVLGHEAMGVVEEVGSEVTHIAPGDRVARRPDRHLLAADRDLAAIGGIHPVQHAHQRGLPRAVLADQRVHFGGAEL